MSKRVLKMLEIAERRGTSKQLPWKVSNKNDIINVYHYDTLILTLTNNKITYAYGISATDARNIRDICNAYNIPYKIISYKPSSDTFIVATDDQSWQVGEI